MFGLITWMHFIGKPVDKTKKSSFQVTWRHLSLIQQRKESSKFAHGVPRVSKLPSDWKSLPEQFIKLFRFGQEHCSRQRLIKRVTYLIKPSKTQKGNNAMAKMKTSVKKQWNTSWTLNHQFIFRVLVQQDTPRMLTRMLLLTSKKYISNIYKHWQHHWYFFTKVFVPQKILFFMMNHWVWWSAK